MPEINGSGGLCLTCNNSPTCYYRASRGPALLCEMFDDYVPRVGRTGLPDAPVRADWQAALLTPAEEATDDFGLCRNCANSRKCMHQRPAGGVWHCEDYE